MCLLDWHFQSLWVYFMNIFCSNSIFILGSLLLLIPISLLDWLIVVEMFVTQGTEKIGHSQFFLLEFSILKFLCKILR